MARRTRSTGRGKRVCVGASKHSNNRDSRAVGRRSRFVGRTMSDRHVRVTLIPAGSMVAENAGSRGF
jgi:hypothetical protein